LHEHLIITPAHLYMDSCQTCLQSRNLKWNAHVIPAAGTRTVTNCSTYLSAWREEFQPGGPELSAQNRGGSRSGRGVVQSEKGGKVDDLQQSEMWLWGAAISLSLWPCMGGGAAMVPIFNSRILKHKRLRPFQHSCTYMNYTNRYRSVSKVTSSGLNGPDSNPCGSQTHSGILHMLTPWEHELEFRNHVQCDY
jgi:hypothetical protein